MPLILSRASDDAGVIDALRAGADDYLTKPFRPGELLARLEAHLRRTAQLDRPPEMLWGGMSIDYAARVVRCDGGREIRLTPIEYRLPWATLRTRSTLKTSVRPTAAKKIKAALSKLSSSRWMIAFDIGLRLP